MGWIHRMPGNFVCMVQPQPTAPAAPFAPSDKQKKSGIHCTKSALDAAAVLQH